MFPGENENYLAITGTTHSFLSGAETFHTPSLGDEEFEIPPIALDADPSLAVSDVVGHFEDLSDPVTAPDATFSGQYGVQALDIPDLDHSMGTQYGANPPVTIDVPMTDISSGIKGHGQLTTIDQSELSSQLGLSLGESSILPPVAQSPEERLTPTPSPSNSLQEEEPEEIRRVYKRKTEAAKKEYLKALAAYRDNQECQTTVGTVELDPITSPSEQPAPVVESASPLAPVPPNPPALESPPTPAPPAIVPTQPTVVVTSSTGPQSASQTNITKIIIPKQMLPSSLTVTSQGGVVTVIPATMVTSRGIQLGQLQARTGTTQIVTRSVLAAAAAATSSMHLPRLQPPPLQQMPQQPPTQPVTILQQPPPLQAMQQPPLQQKVCFNLQQPPPPLQIKILPPPALQIQPIALRTEDGSPERISTELQTSPEPIDVMPEVESPTQMHMELVSELPVAMSPCPRCIRVGCNNPPVVNSDWDNEYCSNECVVKHCRDAFLAWLASRNSNNNIVFVK